MALRDVLKFSRKTFFDPVGWIGYHSLKEQNLTIWAVLKNLFTPAKPERKETFAEAMTRLNLSEKDIADTMKAYRLYTWIFVGIGAFIFFFVFYLLFRYGAFFDWLIGLGASALFFSQAFKYDFWVLQMRKRTLGLTFQDWKKHLFEEEREVK